MTIEMLDTGTILVSLLKQDMKRYALDLDDAVDKTALENLIYRVGEICGFDCRGKSFLIEALPSPKGCLMIISVRTVKRRRIFRIKRKHTRALCVLFDADALLDVLASGLKGGFSVYLYREKYVLLPSLTAKEDEIVRLSEYGELYPAEAASFARVREYGRLLYRGGQPGQRDVQRRHVGGRAVTVGHTAFGRSGGTGDDLVQIGSAG